jgi:hypothetical protein
LEITTETEIFTGSTILQLLSSQVKWDKNGLTVKKILWRLAMVIVNSPEKLQKISRLAETTNKQLATALDI